MDSMETPNSIFGVHQIDQKLFFTVSDEELIRQIHREFSPELDRLKRAYSISDRNIVYPSTLSPSQILYGTQYDEVNRTLVGVLALRWIYHNQYEAFTGTQADSVLLTHSSFNWLRSIFMETMENWDSVKLYAFVVSVLINDLGKDPQFASDYRSKTGEDISALNHDIILLKAVEAHLVPSMDRLPQNHSEGIKRGIRLGAEFNPGQLAQAENAPACLSRLLEMKGHENNFTAHYMQQLLDISGAAGHEDWTCAKKLIQPIARAYQDVYEVALRIIRGDQGLREGYDVILTRRSEMLHQRGFKLLDVRRPEERALMRLLCLGGVSDLEKAEVYWSAWEALDERIKGSLVHSLNVDGSVAEPAVQPTYMPAMLTQGVGQAGLVSREDMMRRLKSMFRYLSRVMTLAEGQFGQVIVIERSVLWVVKDVVQSRAFEDDPTILESKEVPHSSVAKSL